MQKLAARRFSISSERFIVAYTREQIRLEYEGGGASSAPWDPTVELQESSREVGKITLSHWL